MLFMPDIHMHQYGNGFRFSHLHRIIGRQNIGQRIDVAQPTPLSIKENRKCLYGDR